LKTNFDVIVIGAGSVGVPITYFLAERGYDVLCLDRHHSSGQGQNKAAIGGVRATHSDPAKIKICQKSLEIFSQWDNRHGQDVGWKKGGYCFPVYRDNEEELLKRILPIQKGHDLNIDWVDVDRIRDVVPGINPEGLRGGTYSPDDGQVSPLLAAEAMERASREAGAVFKFDHKVTDLIMSSGPVRRAGSGLDFDSGHVMRDETTAQTGREGSGYGKDEASTGVPADVKGVKTDHGTFTADIVVNAAGAHARELGYMAGLTLPVFPDSHEAGISAPVKEFLDPLVVDLRPGPEGRTVNFYFGQNHDNAFIFCYTPRHPFVGNDRRCTSEFMPIIANRLVNLIPRLRNLTIRRFWRGLYPMTPDGVAIVGKAPGIHGMYLAVGMCGQGFMMGPGVGYELASLIDTGKPDMDETVFGTLSPSRDFHAGKTEALK